MAQVAEYKKRTVAEFAKLMNEYPIIGVVNMENLPAPQLQVLREQLRGQVLIKMTKRRLLERALDQVKKPGIEKVKEYLGGMPAILFTKENPFKLATVLGKNKSMAPAKAGQIAPNDIMVTAGPTPFSPGPIIGELGQAGIKAGIEGNKVVIKADKVVVKEGQPVNAAMASLLARLGVQPMEIGLDLVIVYEDGQIITSDVLSIDALVYEQRFFQGASYAFNLAMEIAYWCPETSEPLLARSFRESKALALEAGIMADAVIEDMLIKAAGQGKAVSRELGMPEEADKPKQPETPTPPATQEPPKKAKEEPQKEVSAPEEKEAPIPQPSPEAQEGPTLTHAQEPEAVLEEDANLIKEEEKPVPATPEAIKKAEENLKALHEKTMKKTKKPEKVPSAHDLAKQS